MDANRLRDIPHSVQQRLKMEALRHGTTPEKEMARCIVAYYKNLDTADSHSAKLTDAARHFRQKPGFFSRPNELSQAARLDLVGKPW